MPLVGILWGPDLTFSGGFATGVLADSGVDFSGDDIMAVAIAVAGGFEGDLLAVNVDGPTGPGNTQEGGGFAQLPYSLVWEGTGAVGGGSTLIAYTAIMVPGDATEITVNHHVADSTTPICGIVFLQGENCAEFFPEIVLGDPDYWGGQPEPSADVQTMADLGGPPGTWWQTIAGWLGTVPEGFGEPTDDSQVTLSSTGSSVVAYTPDPTQVTPYFVGGFSVAPSDPDALADLPFPMSYTQGYVDHVSPSADLSWSFTQGPNEAADIEEDYYWSGKGNWWCVYYNPDIIPWPEDPEPGEDDLSLTTPELHIPHKEYAFNQSAVALTPKAQHFYLTNLKTIESWADSLRCSGTRVIDTGEGGEQTVEYNPVNGKWKERQLHIPHKENFTSRHVRENYLAIERWANAICPTLHIPHKDWVLMGTAEQELVNLATIERWARDIGRCCEGVIDDDPPEG